MYSDRQFRQFSDLLCPNCFTISDIYLTVQRLFDSIERSAITRFLMGQSEVRGTIPKCFVGPGCGDLLCPNCFTISDIYLTVQIVWNDRHRMDMKAAMQVDYPKNCLQSSWTKQRCVVILRQKKMAV